MKMTIESRVNPRVRLNVAGWLGLAVMVVACSSEQVPLDAATLGATAEVGPTPGGSPLGGQPSAGNAGQSDPGLPTTPVPVPGPTPEPTPDTTPAVEPGPARDGACWRDGVLSENGATTSIACNSCLCQDGGPVNCGLADCDAQPVDPSIACNVASDCVAAEFTPAQAMSDPKAFVCANCTCGVPRYPFNKAWFQAALPDADCSQEPSGCLRAPCPADATEVQCVNNRCQAATVNYSPARAYVAVQTRLKP